MLPVSSHSVLDLLGNILWPDVAVPGRADFAVRQASYANLFTAAVISLPFFEQAFESSTTNNTLILILTWIPDSVRNIDFYSYGFSGAIAFAILGFWVYRRSRVAAVLSLLWFVTGQLYQIATNPWMIDITDWWMYYLLVLFLMLLLLHGVRGAFAYRSRPLRQAAAS